MNDTKHAAWGATGALGSAAAIAAQMLCCLPFATGIVGSSVAAIAARIAPAQSYLAAASLLSLAYAFYQVYRPRHSRPACEVSASCTSSKSLRFRRVAVWVAAVVVVVLLTATQWVNWLIFWTL